VLELRQAEGIAHLLVEFSPELFRLREKHLYDARVKLLSRISRDLFARCRNRERFPVRPVRDHRVQRVRHRENSRSERNLLSLEAARVA